LEMCTFPSLDSGKMAVFDKTDSLMITEDLYYLSRH